MKTEAAKVSAMIKKQLKAQGIACKVTSKNYSGGNSVTVTVIDQLPKTRELIKEYISQFEVGHFDGMTDCYDYSNIRDDIPQVKFVLLGSEFSNEMLQACWEWLIKYFQFENAPMDCSEAGNYRTRFGDYGSVLLWRELSRGDLGFWSTQKDRVKGAQL
jgi:hypothetical protein